MKQMLDKLKSMVQSLEKKHGSITLAALFLREGSLKKWDIVISSSWLSSSKKESYEIVISEVQSILTSDEFIQLSRVVILDNTDLAVSFLQEVCPLTNGGIKESPKDFSVEPLSAKFGFVIEKAYILRCQKT